MQRLATRILFVVAGFVLVVAVLLVTKSRSVRTEASGPAPTAADLSIKDVELQEESAGGGHWRLRPQQGPRVHPRRRTPHRKLAAAATEKAQKTTRVGVRRRRAVQSE